MTDRTAALAPTATAPRWVRMFSPLAKPLLAAGVPLGFNGLVTIQGRTSGLARTTPVAVIQYEGRRWIWAPWGEVHWVRNLRHAGRATITVRRQKEDVTAKELDRSEREWFFREVMGTLAGSMPGGKWFIRTVDGVDLDDPVEASEGRPVFELHRLA